MTNREKIIALKKVQGYHKEISILLAQIIKDTYDYYCDDIHDFNIGNDSIFVEYEWIGPGGLVAIDECSIPIEWLNEGFDYKAAHKEMHRQAELARLREEKNARKQSENQRKAKAKLKADQEYKKYLALKKKFEGRKSNL